MWTSPLGPRHVDWVLKLGNRSRDGLWISGDAKVVYVYEDFIEMSINLHFINTKICIVKRFEVSWNFQPIFINSQHWFFIFRPKTQNEMIFTVTSNKSPSRVLQVTGPLGLHLLYKKHKLAGQESRSLHVKSRVEWRCDGSERIIMYVFEYA